MTRKTLSKGVLFVCYPFLLAGALNIGTSGYLFAIPFVVLALFLCVLIKDVVYKIITLALVTLSITTSCTLERNPFVFPVLRGGEIVLLSNALHVSYSNSNGDLAGDLYDEDFGSGMSVGADKVMKHSKGEIYQVAGIELQYPDLDRKIYLETDIGLIGPSAYEKGKKQIARINKPIYAEWTQRLGFLLYWPTVLFSKIFWLVLVIVFFIWLAIYVPKTR